MGGRTAAGFSRVGEGGIASEWPEVGNLESATVQNHRTMIRKFYECEVFVFERG